MLADVSKMFAIQRAHPSVIHRDRCTARLASLSNATVTNTATGAPVSGGNLWVPYARWGAAPAMVAAQELIVVAANPDPGSGVTVKPQLSPEFLHSVFGPSVRHFRSLPSRAHLTPPYNEIPVEAHWEHTIHRSVDFTGSILYIA